MAVRAATHPHLACGADGPAGLRCDRFVPHDGRHSCDYGGWRISWRATEPDAEPVDEFEI